MTKKKSTKSTKKTKKTETESKKTKEVDELIADNTKLKLTLNWDEVKTQYDQILKKHAQDIKVEGFRQGKAPLKAAEKKLGRDKLINHTLQTLVPNKYETLIKEEEKEPLTNPEIKPISLEWGEDWKLEINIAEKPEIKLDNYQKAIKEGLKAAKKQLAEQEKAAPEKDEAKEEKKVDKDQEEKKSAQEKEAEQERTKQQERQIKLQQVFKALVEHVEPKIPELLLKDETKREIQRLAKELERMGLSLDDYLERRQQSFEEMSSSIAAQTLGKLQLEFVLRAIEEKEKIEVSEKEEAKELEKLKQPKIKEQLDKNPQYRSYFIQQIKRRKLIDQLLANK